MRRLRPSRFRQYIVKDASTRPQQRAGGEWCGVCGLRLGADTPQSVWTGHRHQPVTADEMKAAWSLLAVVEAAREFEPVGAGEAARALERHFAAAGLTRAAVEMYGRSAQPLNSTQPEQVGAGHDDSEATNKANSGPHAPANAGVEPKIAGDDLHDDSEGGEDVDEVTLVAAGDERRSITAEYDPSCRLVQFVQYGEEVFGTLEPIEPAEWAEIVARICPPQPNHDDSSVSGQPELSGEAEQPLKPIELAKALGIQLWTPVYHKGKGVGMKKTDDGSYIDLGDLRKAAATQPHVSLGEAEQGQYELLAHFRDERARLTKALRQLQMGPDTLTQGGLKIVLAALYPDADSAAEEKAEPEKTDPLCRCGHKASDHHGSGCGVYLRYPTADDTGRCPCWAFQEQPEAEPGEGKRG